MGRSKYLDFYVWILGVILFSLIAVILFIEKLNFLTGVTVLNIAVGSLMFWLYKIFSPNRDDLRKVGLLSLLLGIGLGFINYELLKLAHLAQNVYFAGVLVFFPILVAVILAYIEIGSTNRPQKLALRRVVFSSTIIDIAFLGVVFGMKIAI